MASFVRRNYWLVLVVAFAIMPFFVLCASAESNSGQPRRENDALREEQHRTLMTPSPRLIPKKAAVFANHLIKVVILLFLSAVFAGLTMGIMGMDSLTLEIISESGPKPDCNYAKEILPIRRYGHQTLCTLILANMLANVLIVQELNGLQDRLYDAIHGDGQQRVLNEDDASALWGFVVSTLVILIFTEVLPMSLCKSKHALAVAASGIPLVRLAMVCLYPVAMPLGRVLDAVLPHDAGQVYDRNELKKLMMLHYDAHAEKSGLQHTEVKLLVAAMDFHDKVVRDVMTPIKNVFSVRHSDVLTPELLERLWRSGRSRVPVVSSTGNYCDILLVRDLITYSKGVSSVVQTGGPVTVGDIVSLKTRNVPTVDEDTPLPAMLVFFQRVNTHMAVVHRGTGKVVVDETPPVAAGENPFGLSVAETGDDDLDEHTEMTQLLSGKPSGAGTPVPKSPSSRLSRRLSLHSSMVAPVQDCLDAVGIITLEDVVEELIREEIYDEYDSDNVYEDEDVIGNFSMTTGNAAAPTLAAMSGGGEQRAGGSLKIPRAPRRRPRANFYAYYVHDDEDVELTETQVWAAAYYLMDMCPAFAGWRVGYVKYLLDQVGTVQLRPSSLGSMSMVTPTTSSSPEFKSSFGGGSTSTAEGSMCSPNEAFSAGDFPRSSKKKLMFHQRQSVSGNLPSRRGSMYHPPASPGAVPCATQQPHQQTSAPTLGSTYRHNALEEENHRMFAESASNETMVLYRKGHATDVMTVVLSGSVDILVGRDGFVSQYRSFRFLGEEALMTNLYVPEFTAVVRVPTRLYRIPRRAYDALAAAATYRHQVAGGMVSTVGLPAKLDMHGANLAMTANGPRLIASRQSWANMNILVDDDDRDDDNNHRSKASPTTALLIRGNAYGTFDPKGPRR